MTSKIIVHIRIQHCRRKCKERVFCLMRVDNFGSKIKPSINKHLKYDKTQN